MLAPAAYAAIRRRTASGSTSGWSTSAIPAARQPSGTAGGPAGGPVRGPGPPAPGMSVLRSARAETWSQAVVGTAAADHKARQLDRTGGILCDAQGHDLRQRLTPSTRA